MRGKIIFFLILCFILISSTVFGADYCLYDLENGKILFMGQNDTAFTEKVDMPMVPSLIMPTNDPDTFMGIVVPEEGKTQSGLKGILFTFNVAKGCIVDWMELGFAPFRWIYTKDHQHFFISYKPAADSKNLELMHYNLVTKTMEKIPDIANDLKCFVMSYDQTKLFALVPERTKEKISGKVLEFSYSPLKTINVLTMNHEPDGLFIIDANKYVLIDANEKNRQKNGVMQIRNAADDSVQTEYSFNAPYKTNYYWDNPSQTLIAIFDVVKKNKSYVYKISPAGVTMNETTADWLECQYNRKKDCLYLMGKYDFRIINYPQNKISSCDTGYNVYDSQYRYTINHFPESNTVILYCPAGGKVKFIDLEHNTLLKSVGYGRTSVKVGNFMANLLVSYALSSASYNATARYGYYNIYSVNLFREGTSVAHDQTHSKYFILSNSTRDITVFDSSFKDPVYLVPPESPLTMFQLRKDTPAILVVTNSNIFKVNSENLSLQPVYNFKEKINYGYMLEDEQRLLVLTDRELLVFDTSNLNVINSFSLYGDPKEKYKRIKKGQQRFYYVPTFKI